MIITSKLVMVALYLAIGGLLTAVMLIAGSIEASFISYLMVSIIWPFLLTSWILALLLKIIFFLVEHTWFHVIWLTILLILLFSWKPVNAATITGEQHIAGFSYLMDESGYPIPMTQAIKLLTEVIYHENGGDLWKAYLTGLVVLNRVHATDFPNTVEGVLYQDHPKQYSTTNKFFTKEIPEEYYHLAIKCMKDDGKIPRDVIYQAMFKQGHGVYWTDGKEYFCYR